MNSFFEVSFTYFISIFIILIVGSIFYKVKYGTTPPYKWFNSIITLTATVLTPILAVAAYDSWKKQHVINQQETIIVRVLDQLDKVDMAAKDYFKPIHSSTVIEDNEKYANDIYSSEIQLTFELKKLETLLERTKEIDLSCSSLEKNNVIKFRELVEKHYTYLKFNTEPFLEENKEFKKSLLKNNEINLFIIFGEINIQWNHLSNDIRSIVLGWSGAKLLSNIDENRKKSLCEKSTYSHDEYAKKLFERASINLNLE
ncbi:hypothetical protein J624_1093 [Acinetobacter baumannii 1062314]|uniref:hypothetical protein n=1 Tax=Acinetobacter baumannii TaxID=470 RepID=UPI000448DEC9|nr:hypothetical protein [Acinetobacter baumannii]EXG91909.1 hypothetical protein J624_1093 [Acinetobacter baumannii 1062314]MDN8293065.1 hypothetical protein [Acinetobacter baumannii]